MSSIKNKTQHKTKILLTSSRLLLLNLSQSGCWLVGSNSNKEVVKPTATNDQEAIERIHPDDAKASTKHKPDNSSIKNIAANSKADENSPASSQDASDSQEASKASYAPPVYSPAQSNNAYAQTDHVILRPAEKVKYDNSSQQPESRSNVSSYLQPLNTYASVQEIEDTTIDASQKRATDADSGLEENESYINQPINDLVKIDSPHSDYMTNPFQILDTHNEEYSQSEHNSSDTIKPEEKPLPLLNIQDEENPYEVPYAKQQDESDYASIDDYSTSDGSSGYSSIEDDSGNPIYESLDNINPCYQHNPNHPKSPQRDSPKTLIKRILSKFSDKKKTRKVRKH